MINAQQTFHQKLQRLVANHIIFFLVSIASLLFFLQISITFHVQSYKSINTSIISHTSIVTMGEIINATLWEDFSLSLNDELIELQTNPIFILVVVSVLEYSCETLSPLIINY